MDRLYLGIVLVLVIIIFIIGVLIYKNLNNKEKFSNKCRYIALHKFIKPIQCKLTIDPYIINNLIRELREEYPYYNDFTNRNYVRDGNYIFSKNFSEPWGIRIKNSIVNGCKKICENNPNCKGFHYHINNYGDIVVSFYAKNTSKRYNCKAKEYDYLNKRTYEPPIYYKCK